MSQKVAYLFAAGSVDIRMQVLMYTRDVSIPSPPKMVASTRRRITICMNRDDLLASEDAADVAKEQHYYTFSPNDVTYGSNPSSEVELSLGGMSAIGTNFYLTTRYLNDEGLLPNTLNRSMRHSLWLTHKAGDNLKLIGNVMIDDGGELGGWVNRNFSGKYSYYPQVRWATRSRN